MSLDLLGNAEERRRTALNGLDAEEQAQRGQYFTPHLAARIIAGLPRLPEGERVRVLASGFHR